MKAIVCGGWNCIVLFVYLICAAKRKGVGEVLIVISWIYSSRVLICNYLAKSKISQPPCPNCLLYAPLHRVGSPLQTLKSEQQQVNTAAVQIKLGKLVVTQSLLYNILLFLLMLPLPFFVWSQSAWLEAAFLAFAWKSDISTAWDLVNSPHGSRLSPSWWTRKTPLWAAAFKSIDCLTRCRLRVMMHSWMRVRASCSRPRPCLLFEKKVNAVIWIESLCFD